MANQTSPTSIDSWEDLVSVTFDVGTNSIVLESERGAIATIQCDNFLELHRLARVSFALAEGHDLVLKWRFPVLVEVK